MGQPWLAMAIERYGYLAVLLAIAIESTGIPFPGETTLIIAAVYAGTGGHLSIVGVIVAAAAGAILGDNLGYTVGRMGGYPLLRRFGKVLRLNERHLAYAAAFFQRHGDKTVFFGRFFAVLRAWAAFLAGVNRMPRRSFFIWNALGGIIWATSYGILGYLLGDNLPLLERILRIIGLGGAIALVVVVVAALATWVLYRWGLLRSRRANAVLRRIGSLLVHPEHVRIADPPPDTSAPEAPSTPPPDDERTPRGQSQS